MSVRKTTSKTSARCFAELLGIGFALCMSTNITFADEGIDLEQLTAQWWQWAFSIPTSQNPINDPNGGSCVIGQRGSVWFLAGYSGGTTTRTCSVPAGSTLFFPVINQVGFNSPNCGQGPENVSAKDLRKAIASTIDSVRLTDLSVVLDTKTIYNFERVRSDIFAIALPPNNIGAPPPGCNPGVYSPAVDDGYYLKLDPLNAGAHILHIRSTSPVFTFDMTYKLTIVKVLDK